MKKKKVIHFDDVYEDCRQCRIDTIQLDLIATRAALNEWIYAHGIYSKSGDSKPLKYCYETHTDIYFKGPGMFFGVYDDETENKTPTYNGENTERFPYDLESVRVIPSHQPLEPTGEPFPFGYVRISEWGASILIVCPTDVFNRIASSIGLANAGTINLLISFPVVELSEQELSEQESSDAYTLLPILEFHYRVSSDPSS